MARVLTNPLALAVLGCLTERPMHPYLITTTLRERRAEHSLKLNLGSLYSVIKSLEKAGLVRAARAERDGARPERTVYEITEAGRRAMVDHLHSMLADPVQEYPAIQAALFLAMYLPPEEAVAALQARVERLAAAERAIEAVLALPLPEVTVLSLAYQRAAAQAERRFIADVADRGTRGELGGYDLWARMHEALAAGEPVDAVFDEVMAQFLDALVDHSRGGPGGGDRGRGDRGTGDPGRKEPELS